MALPPILMNATGFTNKAGTTFLEFILAGANAVSVGTVVFHDPGAPMRIHEELQRALAARGFTSLAQAVSYAHRPADPVPPADDDLDFITE